MKPGKRNGVVEYWSDEWASRAARGCWVVRNWIGIAHFETAFSHLCPDNSTQVVDFPHLVRVSQAELGSNQAGLGSNIRKVWKGRRQQPPVLQRNESGDTFRRVELKRHECRDPRIPVLPRVALDRIFAGKSADCCAKVRKVSRKFAQMRPVNPRLFGLLRVRAFFWRVRKREKEPQSHKGTEPIGAHGVHALPCAMAFSSPTFPAVQLSALKCA
jgi:hypothetical protein